MHLTFSRTPFPLALFQQILSFSRTPFPLDLFQNILSFSRTPFPLALFQHILSFAPPLHLPLALQDVVNTFSKLHDVEGIHEASRLIWNTGLPLLQVGFTGGQGVMEDMDKRGLGL